MKTKKPKVSIIITYYNLGDYIEDAIKSAINQTYRNKEIILINDGSTEKKSIKKLNELKEKYKSKVKFIDQKNSGVATARNNAIKESKGKFICCLDGDDILKPQYIEKTSEILSKNKNLGFVTTWVKLFGQVNQTWKCKDYDPLLIHIENIVHISSLFKKKAWEKVKGYSTNVNGVEDWDFWIKITDAKYKWDLIPKTLFMYRKRGYSLIDQTFEKREFLIQNIIKNNITSFNKIYPKLIALFDSKYQEKIKLEDSLYQTIFEYKKQTYSTKETKPINMKSKKILLLCDTPNWAFSNIAKSIKNNLSKETQIEIDYIVNYKNVNDFYQKVLEKDFSLIHFFWKLIPCEFFNQNLNDFYKITQNIEKISNTVITSSIYDHAFLDQESIEKYFDKFNALVDSYTVSSKKLYEIYNKNQRIKKPDFVIQDGVDQKIFYPIDINRIKKSKTELVVGWVGNSKWSIHKGDDIKGLHTIIKPAIKVLKKNGFNIIEKFADRNVSFIPLNKMVNYYSKIDILICASEVEGTPNPVLEAMACGIPIISTNVGIVPEVFGKKQKQFIIKRDINDLVLKIKTLYENPQKRQELSLENQNRIKLFTREKESQKWLNFFQNAIENKLDQKDKKIKLLKEFIKILQEKNTTTENRIRFRKTILNKIEIGLFLRKNHHEET